MPTPEDEFTRELEVFGNEAGEAIQFFYTWLTVHNVMGRDEEVLARLNEATLFWHSVLSGLLTATFITLGRVFDKDRRTHNAYRLLRLAEEHHETIFSKNALASRKRKSSASADRWLNGYLEGAYVPKAGDFKRLRGHVDKRGKTYNSRYRSLRNRVFAHRDVMDLAAMKALFADTNKREMQQLLVFPSRLHKALWNLLNNGKKPVLRPERYASGRIRSRPSPLFSDRPVTVQEEVVRETERFLKSLLPKFPH